MSITAVCCTYKRPRHLGWLIWCFLQQTHRDSELFILDDAGQYENQEGERWRLVSVPRRFRTLGEKRNAAVALAGTPHAYAVWDDDDLYLPWALEASAAALEKAAWSRPSLVLRHTGGDRPAEEAKAGDGFHAAWAFTRKAFESAGGYPLMNSGEDRVLGQRFSAAGIAEADPIALGFSPFFFWGWYNDVSHISLLGVDAYEKLGELPAERVERLVIEPSPVFTHLPGILERGNPRAS